MKILITGNTGYIGPVVINQLHSAYTDIEIVGLDMGYFAHCLTGAETLPESRLNLQYFMDIRKIDSTVLQGVDAIIHLCAISNDPMGNAYEEVTTDINHRSSVKLAQMAKEAGVRKFVFASSCSVYGFSEGGPRCEDDELNPLTAYARSKINTEKDIQPLASDDFVVTSLRFATACGMSERLRLDLVLNDFVAGAVATKEITILSDGTPWRPLIHIEDMARAMEWGVGRESSNGGAFLAINAGSDQWNYQVRELADAVAEQLPHVKVSVNKDAQPDKRSYQVDFGLYRKLAPDHQPQVDLADAITGLREGLEMMCFRDANFRNSSYMRLKVLSHLRETGLLNEALEWQI